ncbi:transposase [Oceanispirochaeta crateris]|uniref:Transposase n=2 Tax=Oceanispirochaeta crateris TaxID=2518645 RepID=A0A5C1QQ81_9SPIO|nr:transposase [Oceanispirochaeta crateris]
MEADMKKRFTEEQIVKILGEQRLGKKVSDVAREYGISENTFYIWKRKYADMSSKEIARLKQLEQENENLKKLVANLSLDNMAQKEIIKKFCDPE